MLERVQSQLVDVVYRPGYMRAQCAFVDAASSICPGQLRLLGGGASFWLRGVLGDVASTGVGQRSWADSGRHSSSFADGCAAGHIAAGAFNADWPSCTSGL